MKANMPADLRRAGVCPGLFPRLLQAQGLFSRLLSLPSDGSPFEKGVSGWDI